MFWAMWGIFALGILAIGLALLYLVLGAKETEKHSAEEKYGDLPKRESEATGVKDNKEHDYRTAG